LALLSASIAASCGVEEDELGTLQQPGGGYNGLVGFDLVKNGLTTNCEASKKMLTVPLATASFADALASTDPLKYQLRHAGTREVMKAVVSCALPAGSAPVVYEDTRYTYTSLKNVMTFKFYGEMGLCPSWATATAKISQQCQELVSSCVVAKVNALGVTVKLSMRGDSAEAPAGNKLALETSVGTFTSQRSPTGTIASFRACDPSAATNKTLTRNCGWKAAHVGQCTSGATVAVGAGGRKKTCTRTWWGGTTCTASATLGSSTGDTMIRVCGTNTEGIHGCNYGDASVRAANDNDAWGSTYPYATFTCPESGFFNVMWTPKDVALTSVTATPAASNATYKASELLVFEYAEGAFYGNLWAQYSTGYPKIVHSCPGGTIVDSSGNILSGDGVPPATDDAWTQIPVYKEMYACSAPQWTWEDSHMTDRLCVGDRSYPGCAAEVTGKCWNAVYPASNMCTAHEISGAQQDADYYLSCIKPSVLKGVAPKIYNYPVSVRLHGKCDVTTLDRTASDLCDWGPVIP
jgi:hypothetical protein